MTDMNDKMDNDLSTKIAVDIILDEDDIVVQPGITQPISPRSLLAGTHSAVKTDKTVEFDKMDLNGQKADYMSYRHTASPYQPDTDAAASVSGPIGPNISSSVFKFDQADMKTIKADFTTYRHVVDTAFEDEPQPCVPNMAFAPRPLSLDDMFNKMQLDKSDKSAMKISRAVPSTPNIPALSSESTSSTSTSVPTSIIKKATFQIINTSQFEDIRQRALSIRKKLVEDRANEAKKKLVNIDIMAKEIKDINEFLATEAAEEARNEEARVAEEARKAREEALKVIQSEENALASILKTNEVSKSLRDIELSEIKQESCGACNYVFPRDGIDYFEEENEVFEESFQTTPSSTPARTSSRTSGLLTPSTKRW